jgi:hypothetical protein
MMEGRNKKTSKKARIEIDLLHFWSCYVNESNTALNTTTPRTLTISFNSAQPLHLETTWRASFWPKAISFAFIPRTSYSCLLCDLLVWWLSLLPSVARMIFWWKGYVLPVTQRLIMFHSGGVKVCQIQEGVSNFLHVCHIRFIFQKAIMCFFHKLICYTKIGFDVWKSLV